MSKTKIAALAALLLSAAGARAAPAVITYSGFLTDSAGNPVTTASTLTFRFYADPSGGSALGSETVGAVVPSPDGYFSVVLGTSYSGTVPWADLFAARRYMSVQFGAESEMDPRIPITSVPSAMTVDWSGVTGFPLSSCSGATPFVTGVDATGMVTCGAAPAGTGTITGVAAGTGLSGGGTSGAVTLSADFTAVQERVAGSCPSGSSIRVINQDGTVACEADDNSGGTLTGIGATGPLSVSSPSGPIPVVSISGCAPNQILKWNGSAWGCAEDAITSVGVSSPVVNTGSATAPVIGLTTACGANQILKWNGSWACAADAVGTGTVTAVTASPPLLSSGGTAPNMSIGACAATGEVLKYDLVTGWQCRTDSIDGGVAAAVACTGCITTSELATGAVASVDVLDGTIGSADIADLGVGTVDVANAAITSAKLAAGSVSGGPAGAIADGTITGNDINTATTITATDFAYTAPVTRYVSLPPIAFRPENDAAFNVGSPFFGYMPSGLPTYATGFSAPLDAIPDGSTVVDITCYWLDNDAAQDFGFSGWLWYRTHTSVGAVAAVSFGRAQTVFNNTAIQSTTVAPSHVVDHSTRSYALYIYDWSQTGYSGNIRFYGCRVGYAMSRPR